MHRSWSMPVAQALQRHSGGWTVKPMDAHAERHHPPDKPALEAPQDGSPTHANVGDDALCCSPMTPGVI